MSRLFANEALQQINDALVAGDYGTESRLVPGRCIQSADLNQSSCGTTKCLYVVGFDANNFWLLALLGSANQFLCWSPGPYVIQLGIFFSWKCWPCSLWWWLNIEFIMQELNQDLNWKHEEVMWNKHQSWDFANINWGLNYHHMGIHNDTDISVFKHVS